jgi:hypothetical protein
VLRVRSRLRREVLRVVIDEERRAVVEGVTASGAGS